MSAAELMRICAEMLTGVDGLTLEKSPRRIMAVVRDDPTITIEQRAPGVVMQVRPWLGARPRPSMKLIHVPATAVDWDALYTESEWHVRGVLARAIERISSRTSLTQ